MTRFTNWAFKNKSAVLVSAILITVMGIVSYLMLPMELLPTSDSPTITVVVLGEGNDAASLEQSVTRPMEKAVSVVKGKTEVFSVTGNGYVKLDIQFAANTDMKEAKANVQDSLRQIPLPPNVSQPYVTLLNTSMISVANIKATFPNGINRENMEVIKDQVIPAFQNIKGVGNVTTYGEIEQKVTVRAERDKMAQRQVSLQALVALLNGRNIATPVGEGSIDGKTSTITVVGRIDSLDQLKNLPVADGVKLSDIAAVESNPDKGSITRINGEDAVIMIITKDAQSNAVKLGKLVKAKAEELDRTIPNSDISVYYATGDTVENSVNNMLKEVLVGALFATIVIMLFLRSFRTTLVTIISIPLSLACTLFLLYQSGITLNILTLGGVAVSVGRLVDDSIVVMENIFRRIQKEGYSPATILDATREVASAITSSTLTTVAVFLPIGLVDGGLRSFLLPLALTVTYSLLSSLLVAVTVVPLMSARFLKTASLPTHRTPIRYLGALKWSLNHKWIILLLTVALFGSSVYTFISLPQGTINNSAAEFVMVGVQYPPETPVENVREKALSLEKFIQDKNEHDFIYTQMGNSSGSAQWGQVESPTKANITVRMKKGANAETLIKAVENQRADYPEARITVGSGSISGSSNAEIYVDVVGRDNKEIESTASEIQKAIAGTEGVLKINSNQDEKKPVYTLNVQPDKTNVQDVAAQLSILFRQVPLGKIQLNGTDTPVYLQPLLQSSTRADLDNMTLQTPGGPVSVASVAQWQLENKGTQILQKNGEPYIRITAAVDPAKVSIASANVKNAIFGTGGKGGIKIPDGMNVYVGGASTQQANDFTDLFITMLISIGIVYLILVITFKSIRTPIVILFSLPLAAIGAILGLLVSGISVDVTALLGGLLLIGIVVTNAIVLIDRIKHNEETMTIRDSIMEAASVRLRPIIMTAVATICAMLPLMFRGGEGGAESGNLVSTSLATVVSSGLLLATLMTLIVVPVIYELFHFRKAKKQRKIKTPQVHTSSIKTSH